jgi:hypothetical protein
VKYIKEMIPFSWNDWIAKIMKTERIFEFEDLEDLGGMCDGCGQTCSIYKLKRICVPKRISDNPIKIPSDLILLAKLGCVVCEDCVYNYIKEWK